MSDSPTTRLDTDAISARVDAASPGQWAAPDWDEAERGWFIHNGLAGQAEHAVAFVARMWSSRAEADAVFIQHAPADVRALLAEVASLRAVVRRVVSITQDTDGQPLDPDTEIPVGEVLRMLYEFHEGVVAGALAGQPSSEPGA